MRAALARLHSEGDFGPMTEVVLREVREDGGAWHGLEQSHARAARKQTPATMHSGGRRTLEAAEAGRA
jgi:hypothetical protein